MAGSKAGCKMLAIGLGKQHGAASLHASGFENFHWLIPLAGRFLLERLPVPFGIALVDNGYGELALLQAIPAEEIETREAELLDEARRRMARLPLEAIDVLVVDQMGKDISGAGMDPNVIGRAYKGKLPGGLDVQRIVVLDLTETTEGNAVGVGVAEFCTERLASKIDRVKTYMNQLTSRTPEALDCRWLPRTIVPQFRWRSRVWLEYSVRRYGWCASRTRRI